MCVFFNISHSVASVCADADVIDPINKIKNVLSIVAYVFPANWQMPSCVLFSFYSQVRVGNETIKSNLQAYRYHFEDNAMDNGFVDERNKCFCRNGKLNNCIIRNNSFSKIRVVIHSYRIESATMRKPVPIVFRISVFCFHFINSVNSFRAWAGNKFTIKFYNVIQLNAAFYTHSCAKREFMQTKRGVGCAIPSTTCVVQWSNRLIQSTSAKQ